MKFGKAVSNLGKQAGGLINDSSRALTPAPVNDLLRNADKRFVKAKGDVGAGWESIRHGLPVGTSPQEADRRNRASEETAGIQAANAHTAMLAALPQLQDRQGLGTLGAAGQFQATKVAQSPWEAMAQRKQGLDQSRAGDAMATSMGAAAAQTRGAAGPGMANSERAGLGSMQLGAQNKLGLMTQGGQQRQAIAQQGAAKGLDIEQFNASQTNQAGKANVGAIIQDVNQQNAFNRLKFGEQMKFKAGQETGAAMDKASGGKK